MKKFTDNRGREWNICVTVDTVRRVRNATNINLCELVGGNLLERLIADPVLLCDVLFAAIGEDSAKITLEDFSDSISGDALDSATAAFLDALTDFFPKAQREILRKALGQYRSLTEKAVAEAIKKMDAESGV